MIDYTDFNTFFGPKLSVRYGEVNAIATSSEPSDDTCFARVTQSFAFVSPDAYFTTSNVVTFNYYVGKERSIADLVQEYSDYRDKLTSLVSIASSGQKTCAEVNMGGTVRFYSIGDNDRVFDSLEDMLEAINDVKVSWNAMLGKKYVIKK